MTGCYNVKGVDPTLRAMLPLDTFATRSSDGPSTPQRSQIAYDIPNADGWANAATIRNGFSIVVADFATTEQLTREFHGGDHLKIHCKLAGAGSSERNPKRVVEAGRLSFLVQPPECSKREIARAAARTRFVTIVCSRDFVSELIPNAKLLPDGLNEFLAGPVARSQYRAAPLPPAMRLIAENMLLPRPDRIADLMLEAKALELLCLSLREFTASTRVDSIESRTRQKIQALCELLTCPEGMTLSSAQLSRALAWNETQMMEGFKHVTGMTITAYRLQLRMDAALDQLQTSDRSITEIAFNAGYEHPSNFSLAFKRTFGFSPKMSRARLSPA